MTSAVQALAAVMVEADLALSHAETVGDSSTRNVPLDVTYGVVLDNRGRSRSTRSAPSATRRKACTEGYVEAARMET